MFHVGGCTMFLARYCLYTRHLPFIILNPSASCVALSMQSKHGNTPIPQWGMGSLYGS